MERDRRGEGDVRSAEVDAFKGILILLIVLGHNYYFSRYWPLWFNALYNFHVACFLLLPFIFPLSRLGPSGLGNRLFRTLVPQFAFLCIALLTYFFMFVGKDLSSVIEWLRGVGVAVMFQTEGLLNQASGFRHFWFLPAMAMLLLWLYLYDHLDSWGRGLASICALALHGAVGLLSPSQIYYLPWGVAIVCVIFLPGLVVRWVDRHLPNGLVADILLISLWCLLLWVSLHNFWFMALAGDIPQVKSWLEPSRLLFHDALLITSFFALKRIAARVVCGTLVALGRISLQLFLLVPLLWQLYWMGWGKGYQADSIVGRLALTGISLLLMVLLGYGLARVIAATRLQALLFPRSVAQWHSAFSIQREMS